MPSQRSASPLTVASLGVLSLTLVCGVLGCGSDRGVPNGASGSAGSSAGSPVGGGDVPGAGGAAPVGDVIQVESGDFRIGETPPENAADTLPAISSLTGPTAVTNGGTAILHIELSSPVADPLFLVSLVGDAGYHTLPGVDTDQDGVYDITVQVSGDAEQPSLVLRVAVTDGEGNVGPYSELEIDLVQSGQGDVKITLSFDRTHDLDLHVVEPNGEEISYENNASATGGELDLDSGEHCKVSPANSENIFWPPGGAPSGQYRVSVVNYEHCTPGVIEFRVRVAYDTTVTTYRGSFGDGEVGGVFDVVTFER
jgi:hypothetical protein